MPPRTRRAQPWNRMDSTRHLSMNPGGYCGLGGTGVSCPVGLRLVAG